MQINSEDITLPWGQTPDPLDVQMGRWRMAVFQDVQESLDKTKLYFLYDPVADENSGTSGGRKGNQGLVIFDVRMRCFTREIPIYLQGAVKMLFALKCPSPSGGSSFALVTESNTYGQTCLLLWRLNMSSDGCAIEVEPQPLLNNSIPINGEFIISMREDAPELVLMTSPGLTVWRINCLADKPSNPTDSYSVPNADLSHFYDAFVSRGNIYFLSASPDGHLDYTRVHVLQITGRGMITTQQCSPDPQRGNPCARKQAALDSISGYILLAGGEVDYGDSVTRLVDYWVLDLSTYRWLQIPAQMPTPLIEPRLTTTNSGNVYIWGDFDQPLPGMQPGTHLRILRITGFETMNPPSYSQAMSQPVTAPYAQAASAMNYSAPYTSPSWGSNLPPYPPTSLPIQPQQTPYPTTDPSNPITSGIQPPVVGDYSHRSPAYPAYEQQAAPYVAPTYGNPSSAYPAPPQQTPHSSQPLAYPPPPEQTGSGQYAYYPPNEKKDCCIQ